MNKEKIIESLKTEIIDSISYFEVNEILSSETSDQINQFIDEIKDLDIKDIYEKVNVKYGWFINYYRELKRNSEISTIKSILNFFYYLTIISIIVGVIAGIVIATS